MQVRHAVTDLPSLSRHRQLGPEAPSTGCQGLIEHTLPWHGLCICPKVQSTTCLLSTKWTCIVRVSSKHACPGETDWTEDRIGLRQSMHSRQCMGMAKHFELEEIELRSVKAVDRKISCQNGIQLSLVPQQGIDRRGLHCFHREVRTANQVASLFGSIV